MKTGGVVFTSASFYFNTTKKNNMPYRQVYVEPEVMVNYKGVRVLHTYKNMDWEQGTNTNWFALEGWEEDDEFDIRELPNWNDPHPPYMNVEENKTPENKQAWKDYFKNERKIFQKILREAIKLGYLTVDELGVGHLNYEGSKIEKE